MALLDIGTQCSLSSCSTHDFLPILCPDCSKSFCKHHIHSDLHSCLSLPQKSDVQHAKLRCALNNCNRLSLDVHSSAVAATYANCDKSFFSESELNESYLSYFDSFSSRHRHSVSHKCISAAPIPQDVALQTNEKARTLLTKISSVRTRNPIKKTTKLPTSPMRLAAYRRVEVMKMQHKAVPLDPKDKLASPPLDQRLHIRVQYCEQDKIFWVRKVRVALYLVHLVSDERTADAHRGQSSGFSMCSI